MTGDCFGTKFHFHDFMHYCFSPNGFLEKKHNNIGSIEIPRPPDLLLDLIIFSIYKILS